MVKRLIMENSMTKPQKISKQTEDQISIYTGLEAVRKKVSMYLGDTGSGAVFQAIKEVIDNAVDEALAGRNDFVGVSFGKDDKVTVWDRGGGIPVKNHPQTGKPVIVEVFSRLHAGSKMGDKNSSKAASVGCFTGDTRIKCLDGTTPTMEQLYKRWQKKPEPFWVYSFSKKYDLPFIARKCYHVQLSKYVAEIAIVALDNGEKIKCTTDHPFITWKGNAVKAANLKAGQYLRALDEKDTEKLRVSHVHDSKTNNVGTNPKAVDFAEAIEYKTLQQHAEEGLVSTSNANSRQVKSVVIRKLKKPVPVYGISVQGEHNYLLKAGVFVKNTHGVGSACTNAISHYFHAITFRDGKCWEAKFKDGNFRSFGKFTGKVKSPDGKKMTQGTTINFKPDLGLLDKGSKINYKKVMSLLDTYSYLHPKVKFMVVDEEKGKIYNYHQPDGVKALLLKRANELGVELDGKMITVSTPNLNIAIQWSSHTEELVSSYVNGSPTVEGGTHLNGLFSALNEAVKPYKGKKKFTPKDLRTGLIGMIDFKMPSPTFDSQTKEKLKSADAEYTVHEQALKELQTFFKNNKSFVKSIVDRASEFNALQSAFSASKKMAAKLTGKKAQAQLPAKLADALTKDPKEKELFLVEGDSAGGTAKKCRNVQFQAILPLRGKILNVYNGNNAAKALDNEECFAILSAIGYDPNSKQPEKNLRVGKIIMLADPDVDGAHIRLLILSLLYKILPKAFVEKIVFDIDAPLFKANYKGKLYHGKTLKALKKQLPEKAHKDIVRIKGWGEINAEDNLLQEVVFDPKTRKLLRVKEVSKDKQGYFAALAGEQPQVRKNLLFSSLRMADKPQQGNTR